VIFLKTRNVFLLGSFKTETKLFVRDVQKHTQTILVSGEYVLCLETNSKDFMIVFLIKLCHVCECKYVRHESWRIFRHIFIYHHTDFHLPNLVVFSVPQWSVKFIDIGIPHIIAKRGMCCIIFGELNFTLDCSAYVTVFSVDK
jgi:hypothetical protein